MTKAPKSLKTSRMEQRVEVTKVLYRYVSESYSVVSDSFATQWTLQSMEFSRLEYWSG